MNTTPFGFRILGSCDEERRLVDHAGAFIGYASCDPLAKIESEAYLSAFAFGDDFRDHLKAAGSVRGFEGACSSPWLWFDIDRVDLDAALQDARRLAHYLVDRYQLDDDTLLMFFSGSKGFHLGLPTSLWGLDPSTSFHRVCRRLAEGIAEKAGVVIDTGVYDRVRAFRAPNSRHPKTGLFKRRLAFDELMGLTIEGIRQLASKPEPFDLPNPPPICERAKADWCEAVELVLKATEAKSKSTTTSNGKPRLNRLTVDFIRNGAGEGDRHRLLYSAARNLGEFGCPPALALAILEESALDSGLAPKDVDRQIRCGLSDQSPLVVTPPSPSTSTEAPSEDLQRKLDERWSGSVQTASPADKKEVVCATQKRNELIPTEFNSIIEETGRALAKFSRDESWRVGWKNRFLKAGGIPDGDKIADRVLAEKLVIIRTIAVSNSGCPPTTAGVRALCRELIVIAEGRKWNHLHPKAKLDQLGDAIIEVIPENPGDAWEHPLDRLGIIDPNHVVSLFGANCPGPYDVEGGRR